MKILEVEISTSKADDVTSNPSLYLACTLSFETDNNAAITPARNSQALFCGAKYSVVPRFETLSNMLNGSRKLNDRIAKRAKIEIAEVKLLFLTFL